jgi:hypothetical protein
MYLKATTRNQPKNKNNDSHDQQQQQQQPSFLVPSKLG